MNRYLILLSILLAACAKSVPAPGGLGEPCVANGDCATGFLCAAGRCVLPANLGGCEPSRLRCNGADVEQCDANGLSWSLVMTCATGCSAGACKPQICTPGKTRCEGNASEQCTPAGDSWALVQICPSTCAADTGQCKAPICTPFSTRCDPAGNPGLSQVCDSAGATWQNLPCGASQVCDGGRCLDVVCGAGDTRCSANGGSVETCNAKGDGWTAAASCAVRCALSAGFAACLDPQCAVGEQKCDGSAVEQCLPDRSGWAFVTFCATGCVSPTAGVAQCATPVCAPFSRQCASDGGSVQICKADGTGWAQGDLCPQGCSGGNCTTVSAGCNPGDLRCNGVDAQMCAQASPGVTQWDTFATCVAGCSSGACLPGGSCGGVTLHAAASSAPGDGISTVLVYSDVMPGLPDGQVFSIATTQGLAPASVKSYGGRVHFKVTAPKGLAGDATATVTAQLSLSSFCTASVPITFTAAPSSTVFVAEDFTNPALRNLSIANAADWNSTAGALVARWPDDVGGGEDGALSVAAATTENLSSDGRAPAFAVLGLAGRVVSLDASAFSLSTGDEVVLWDVQGSASGTSNAGVYELHHVADVSGSTVTLAEDVSAYFGAAADQDVALQHVSLQRVPHLASLTVAGTLTANAWDGTKGGLIFIRVLGDAVVSGEIRLDGAGFRGGRTGTGEDPTGYPALGGSGAGTGTGGGSYGTAGGGTSGSVYGLPLLGKLYLGAGGGGSLGGAGGGAIVLFAGNTANNIVVPGGRIHADGAVAGTNSGSGAGGSVWVAAPLIKVGASATPAFSAQGGAASSGGNAGGAGRIRVDQLGTDAGASCTRAAPQCTYGVAGALVGQSLDEYGVPVSSGLAIKSATLVLALGAPSGISYFGAANTNDPPDFGALSGGAVTFLSGSSPAQGTRFRWKALMSPAPGAPLTLLGLQWTVLAQ